VPTHLLRTLSLILIVTLGFGVMQLPGSNIAAATKSSTISNICSATQLDVTLESAFATFFNVAYVVDLRNSSNIDCTLRGYPKLQMLNKDGWVISTQTLHRSIFGSSSTVVKLVTVKPSWSALFDVTYPNRLRYAPASCPTSNRVEILFSDAKRSIAVRWRIRPYGGTSIAKLRCGVVRVSPFYGPFHLS
jgi:hypothetical protein